MTFETYKSLLLKFYNYWTRLSYIKYILFSILIILVLTIPFAGIFEFMGIDEDEIGGVKANKYSIVEFIFGAVILAPIVETVFLQLIPIKFIQKYVKWNTNRIAIITSTLLFAIAHITYSFWYFLLMLPMGFVLAVTFVTFQKRKQSSFWTTSIIHALRNSLALISYYLL